MSKRLILGVALGAMAVLLVACEVEQEVEDITMGREGVQTPTAAAVSPTIQATSAATAAPIVPPQPTADCPRTWELCQEPRIATAAELDAYVANQRNLLATMASVSPDRPARAGVNLKRLLTQPELDALLARYGLEWRNIWWEASNDVHGVIAPEQPRESLTAMEAYLKSIGDLGPDDRITGGYYFTVREKPLATLAALDQESDVLLVDIGPLDQFDAAIADLNRLDVHPPGACLSFCEGFSLWYQQQRIARAAE